MRSCLVVSCDADLAGQTIDVTVLADPDAGSLECHENNNGTVYHDVGCGNIPY